MPCLNLSTNVTLDGVETSAILSEATSTVASIIGKRPSSSFLLLCDDVKLASFDGLSSIPGSVPMAFGGTEQPAANGELVSIGGLDPDVNKKLNAAISSILEKKLSVPKSRFFFKFFETKANQSQEHAECLHALHQH